MLSIKLEDSKIKEYFGKKKRRTRLRPFDMLPYFLEYSFSVVFLPQQRVPRKKLVEASNHPFIHDMKLIEDRANNLRITMKNERSMKKEDSCHCKPSLNSDTRVRRVWSTW
jgi:hypothetical protein